MKILILIYMILERQIVEMKILVNKITLYYSCVLMLYFVQGMFIIMYQIALVLL